MPAARRSTSSWRWPTGKRPSSRSIVMRFFNTVGPRQTGQYGMVVPTFVRQALQNEPITVFGDGSQSAQLHLRRRRGRGAGQADGGRRRQSARCSTSAISEEVSDSLEPGRAHQEARTGSSSEIKSPFPTTRPTKRGSRTCRAGCPTSPRFNKPRSATSSDGGKLDEIIERVVAEKRTYASAGQSRLSSS